jgi:hypothetical protein
LNKHLVGSETTCVVPNSFLQIDRIFITHYHNPEDGFPNLEDIDDEAQSDDQSSSSSVVRKTLSLRDPSHKNSTRFGPEVRIEKYVGASS